MAGYLSVYIKLAVQNKSWGGKPYWWRLGLLSQAIYDLKHTTLEVVELIIIEVYGSTVFGVVGFIIVNDFFYCPME